MARGDECKIATKTSFVKQFEFPAPMKKPIVDKPQPAKKEEQKNYGAWGSTFKDKKTFTDMHFC